MAGSVSQLRAGTAVRFFACGGHAITDQASRSLKGFYLEPYGKRWALTQDLKTGQPYVLHRLGEDEPEVELALGSFLVLFHGQERDNLLRLIWSSLLPDEEASNRDGASSG